MPTAWVCESQADSTTATISSTRPSAFAASVGWTLIWPRVSSTSLPTAIFVPPTSTPTTLEPGPTAGSEPG
jgi:hypothetical protein